jgi:hypothetical protein
MPGPARRRVSGAIASRFWQFSAPTVFRIDEDFDTASGARLQSDEARTFEGADFAGCRTLGANDEIARSVWSAARPSIGPSAAS